MAGQQGDFEQSNTGMAAGCALLALAWLIGLCVGSVVGYLAAAALLGR